MAQHSTLGPADGIHKPYSFEFADASARASATNPVTSSAYTSADVGKIALQTDDGSIWRLTATTPTWAKIAQQTDVDTVNTALTTHTSNTSNPHSVTASQIGPLNAGEVTTISPSNYTPSAATLAGNLSGIDTALASAGATPGGSNKFVQYNNSGSFGGHTDFQIDTSTGKLSAPITESDHVSLVEQASAPAQPASGFGALYAKNDSKLYYQDDSGTETELTASGGEAAGSANQIQYNDGNNAFAASAAKASSAGALDLPEIADPSNPSSGFVTLYGADGSVAAAPPRLRLKDSAGLIHEYLPRVRRKGIGSRGTESITLDVADFTKSNTEFLVFVLLKTAATLVAFQEDSSTQFAFLELDIANAMKSRINTFCDGGGNIKVRDGNGSNYAINRSGIQYRGIGDFVLLCIGQFKNIDGDIVATGGYNRVGRTDGMPNGFLDYTSNGELELGFGLGGRVVSFGVIDGIGTGTVGAGVLPWSGDHASAYASTDLADHAMQLAQTTWLREGRLRALTSAEQNGGPAVSFDRVYHADENVTTTTTDGLEVVTAWTKSADSVDTAGGTNAAGDSINLHASPIQTDVLWEPQT